MSEPTRIHFTCTPDERGRLNPDAATIVRSKLARWAGKHCNVVITRYVKKKTTNQLGYFFGAIVPPWSEHTGYEPDEMYEELWLAYMPLVERPSKLTGELTMERPRISEATSEQMSALIDRCLKEGALLAIPIQSPEDYFTGDPTL